MSMIQGPRHRQALTVVYHLLLLAVLIGIASLAIEFGVMRSVQSELQSSVDAAALAGGMERG